MPSQNPKLPGLFEIRLFYDTVKEGNFVLEYNFVQKKIFFARIIAHLFIIMEGKKNF